MQSLERHAGRHWCPACTIVPAQNLHMTLAFIGEYDSGKGKGSDWEGASARLQAGPLEGISATSCGPGVKRNQKLKSSEGAEGGPEGRWDSFENDEVCAHITLIGRFPPESLPGHLPKAEMAEWKSVSHEIGDEERKVVTGSYRAWAWMKTSGTGF